MSGSCADGLQTSATLFLHTIAMPHPPDFRAENAGELPQDLPRIPLHASAAALHESATRGQQTTGLLDLETPVASDTAGNIRAELRAIGAITWVGGASINPALAISY